MDQARSLPDSPTLFGHKHVSQTQKAQLLGARHDISALTKLLEAFNNHTVAGLNVLRRSHTESQDKPRPFLSKERDI
jgi:hypothetical protein